MTGYIRACALGMRNSSSEPSGDARLRIGFFAAGDENLDKTDIGLDFPIRIGAVVHTLSLRRTDVVVRCHGSRC